MLTIFAVSDSIGETAQQVAMAAASQFKDNAEVKRFFIFAKNDLLVNILKLKK